MLDAGKPKPCGDDFSRAESDDFDKIDTKDLTAHRAPQVKEEKFAGKILSLAGIAELTAESGIDAVEAALRRLRHELSGVDRLRETAVRSETIKHLQAIGIQAPAQIVDAALGQSPRQDETRKIAFHEPEPWNQLVDGSILLDEISSALRRFVVLPAAEIRAITLWIVHTYAVDATAICPILVIKSAEKRCGKTLVLELLLNLVFRPLPTSNITASSLFRAIEKYKPCLLQDEADTFLYNNDDLRGIFNSGYRRSGSFVIRTVGENFEPVVFNTFGPKAIAQIGAPHETIMDRGIIIEMRRKKPGERAERLRTDRVFEDFSHLRRKVARWSKDNILRLTDYEPLIPESLNDRARDSWRPLLAIAELAGTRWEEYGRACAVKLCEGKSEVSRRALLLADIREIFIEARAARMTSADICSRLAVIEEHPWPEWKDGKPITARQFARMLEPLAIKPKQLRMGEMNIRGYEIDDFTDSFARYLPDFHSGNCAESAAVDGSATSM